MISTISPTPPLGPYPHDRLWGHTGIIPKSANIKITSKIVPSDMIHPPVNNEAQSSIEWFQPEVFLGFGFKAFVACC